MKHKLCSTIFGRLFHRYRRYRTNTLTAYQYVMKKRPEDPGLHAFFTSKTSLSFSTWLFRIYLANHLDTERFMRRALRRYSELDPIQ